MFHVQLIYVLCYTSFDTHVSLTVIVACPPTIFVPPCATMRNSETQTINRGAQRKKVNRRVVVNQRVVKVSVVSVFFVPRRMSQTHIFSQELV